MDPLARMAEGMEKEAANLLIAMARELEVVSEPYVLRPSEELTIL